MIDNWYARTPEDMLPSDTCRDVSTGHAFDTGHGVTDVVDAAGLIAVWCDDCDWHVLAARPGVSP